MAGWSGGQESLHKTPHRIAEKAKLTFLFYCERPLEDLADSREVVKTYPLD